MESDKNKIKFIWVQWGITTLQGESSVFTTGEYQTEKETYGIILNHTKNFIETVLVLNGEVQSAYKKENDIEYSFLSNSAREMYRVIQNGLSGCKPKNGTPMIFELGSSMIYSFTKSKVEYNIELFNSEIISADISWGESSSISLRYTDNQTLIPPNIPYIQLSKPKKVSKESIEDLDEVVVRSVDEIALEKEDVSWLQNKQYFIVNDDEQAEKIFNILDNWDGPISYDTETTGLKINCFGKINSSYKRTLEEYNSTHDIPIRADRLVGIIFCVEDNISYYFPCFNRKFKNLYDSDSDTRRKTIEDIKSRYTTKPLNPMQWDMYDYINNTPPEDWGCDVILMERVRHILETKHIVAHNGAFEYKVGCQYGIDTNLKDDTMIMHQIMYKFRSTTSNRGEPSNLKYLAKVELNIDQWELSDFFPDFKEDSSGLIRGSGKARGKKKGSKIDFSYMDYDGTRVYAPTDGDVTFLLFKKYKTDMIKNHKEQEYLYNVEVIVACCIGYMEFWGHRLDETKIIAIRDQTRAEMICIESEIRQKVNFADEKEIEAYNLVKDAMAKFKEVDSIGIAEDIKLANDKVVESVDNLRASIDNNKEHEFNIDSPAQVGELFYDILKYPMQGEKKSVAKKEIKPLLKVKNEDGSLAYPVVSMYSEYKQKNTQLTKFFDSLPDFMYPGGFIFTSFGQISTATGRMSASRPNSQQYAKSITKIVIPRDGFVMLDADYSQIEYRVLTALAGNEGLAKLFEDPDSDYHTLMASMMYDVPYAAVTPKMRSDAKSFNFGIPYGMGFGSLAILLTGNKKPSSIEEAKEKYELYFKNQPKTRKFFDQIKEMAQINKFTKTHWGRYRYYSFTDADGSENNARKAAALRQAGNAVIQGCVLGHTLINTKEYGIVKIQDVENQTLHVWNGTDWTLGDILYSGKKRHCIVTFETGQKFECSTTHKFLVQGDNGDDKFIECQNLKGSDIHTIPHRVIINQTYSSSNYHYCSNPFKTISPSNSTYTNPAYLDEIRDSFGIGMVLGRLASSGSITNTTLTQLIPNQSGDVAFILLNYMSNLDISFYTPSIVGHNQEESYQIKSTNPHLIQEIQDLDITHQIHTELFKDTELLRGYLRGLFDGSGEIFGNTLSLTFHNSSNPETLCYSIQKSLLFFGIRSNYREYNHCSVINIFPDDIQHYLDTIGFISKLKTKMVTQLSSTTSNSSSTKYLTVKSIKITDDYVDMYDVCNTEGGYYVADGFVTHNTAADIFKISVARNFMYIREQHLLGQLIIVNMIHDEQLMEVDAQHLNVQRALADVGANMQFKVEGFPPLYIGAGIGPAWGEAKGKMAEIHPLLLNQLSEEAKSIPIKRTEDTYVDPKEILGYFSKRVVDFRRDKVRDYLLDPSNYGKDIHPAIGNLLNLQFTFGHVKEKEGLKDDEFTLLCVKEFIEHEHLDTVKPEFFIAQEENIEEDEEEQDEYTDGDEEDFDEFDEINDQTFKLVDESDVIYGITIQDLIHQFHFFISPARKICGIDGMRLSSFKKDELVDYLYSHLCDKDSPNSMEIVFLQAGNILNYTGYYVNNINEEIVQNKIGV